ncbi:MAG TPA: glycosyltransferase family 4 protein [Thermoanaerobaculales bacterium]|nr:glycosyltransferase family 4 protein [Thermoanaerobaculales bacterium]
MRILLVHDRYQNRGGEDLVFEAEKGLLERARHEVLVYERHNDEISDYSTWRRADLLRRAVWATDSAGSIRKILVQSRPQVVHFYNTFPLISPAAYYACEAEGVPVVQTLSNYRLICPGAHLLRDGRVCELCVGRTIAWDALRYGCYRESRAQTAVVTGMLSFHSLVGTWKKCVHTFIALTEFSRQKFIDGGLPKDRIAVKPNFLYPDPGPRADDAGYALFLGRLSEEKGIATLLQAWETLPDIPLKVVGDGPLASMVNDAHGRAAGAGIEVVGWRSRPEVIGLLSHASFLVLPSLCYEAFPLTLVEAFACGVPVIGSRLGGIQEIIRHEESGLLFDPADATALADAARRLWGDATLRSFLGNGARAQFEALYTAERNYSMLIGILESAAS